MSPVQFKPSPEIDPIEEAKEYVLYQWFQPMLPVRTRCYRCHTDSPIVYIPGGESRCVLAFGDPAKLRPHGGHRARDITRETVSAFADIGWKYQLRRAYCPVCKGLGSI